MSTRRVVEEDQKWLLDCLVSTLDQNQQLRSLAESSLHQASLQPGFASALLKLSSNTALSPSLRQLSSLVLNQFLKKHWREDSHGFQPPLISLQEKLLLRRLLLLQLDDPHKKIRTSIALALASIAQFDWPDHWPELLPFLLQLLHDTTNLHGIRGSLLCLSHITLDFDDKIAPELCTLLFTSLYGVVSSIRYDNYIRGKAVSIAYSCISMLGIISGVYTTVAFELLSQTFKPWVELFSNILNTSVSSEDPEDWGLRLEVLKCLSQCFQNFPNLLSEAEYVTVVGNLWHTFISSLQAYHPPLQECDELVEYDSDGVEKSLDSLVVQLLEIFLTMIGSRKLLKIVESNLMELVYYTVGFMQITERQINDWNSDVNRYVSDEEDVNRYGVRGSGSLLLVEIATSCGEAGVDAVIKAVEIRFDECKRDWSSGHLHRWKIPEAVLFVLSCLSRELTSSEVGKSRLPQLLVHMIAEFPLNFDHGYPFLYGKLLSTTALFSGSMSSVLLEQSISASIHAVRSDISPPILVGACRAISDLFPRVDKHVIGPHIKGLCASLADLQIRTNGEMLHLVLDTLCTVIKSGGEVVSEIEPIMSPLALDLWASHVYDPFISAEALDIIEAIKNSPSCERPLVSRCLPHIGSILSNPGSHPDSLVAASLDFLAMLLKRAPIDVVKAVHDACFNSVIRILLSSEDHGEMQNATECLSLFVAHGKQELLAWGGDPVLVMRSLKDVVSRLLDPGMDSSGSLFAGTYIMNLISWLPSQMAENIEDLAAALVRRMRLCHVAGVKASLLVVFARMVHLSFPNVHKFIELLGSLRVEGYDSALEFVMSEWVLHQGDVQGSHQIKVTTTALTLLISARHPDLERISVKGNLVNDAEGIKTRSRAKICPDKWTKMALPVKIIALLADVILEIQEQVACVEEDEDWDEERMNKNGPPSSLNVDAMAEVFHDGKKDSEEGLLWAGDPFGDINVYNYLVDFFVKLYSGDRDVFLYICNSLTQAQQNAIKDVLRIRGVL